MSAGGIVGLIQNIAGRINLLALNATIEAISVGTTKEAALVLAR